MAVVVDEYDPMKPNDYEECKQKQREKEQREKELERSQRGRDSDDRLVFKRLEQLTATFFVLSCMAGGWLSRY